MNRVILIGNLTKDPESRTTQSGIANCTFTIAVTRKFAGSNGEKQTDFIPIVTWRKTAELCGKYLSKGKKVAIVGEIQTRSYDAKDGTKRYVTEVVADEVEFLSPRDAKQESVERSPELEGFEDIMDDDLPFS